MYQAGVTHPKSTGYVNLVFHKAGQVEVCHHNTIQSVTSGREHLIHMRGEQVSPGLIFSYRFFFL